MAVEAHSGTFRKSGEPYIFHPLAVAQICVSEIGLGTTSVVAALLHDVVEDTPVTLEDISKRFGDKVALIIEGLTKISTIFDHQRDREAENIRKLVYTFGGDVRVILIKLADRLHNMRTLSALSRDQQLKIAEETYNVFAPIAHRLGLYLVKSELEDLYLSVVDEPSYTEVSRKIKASKGTHMKSLREFMRPVRARMEELGISCKVKYRIKSIHSVWEKMEKKGVLFEEVFDLYAVRIILDCDADQEKALCWQAYSTITDFYKPNPGRLRDWVSTPRANGYESLHTTVMSDKGQWVEVQIRTQRMDDIAEKGFAAHWKYKGAQQHRVQHNIEHWINRIKDLLESQGHASAQEFVDDFKSNLYNEEVFTFTPKGQLITLPRGAILLDFAYEIHSEIGNSCVGGKVNGKLMGHNYVLSNGDQIEILRSKKQSPGKSWIGLVKTSKAKTGIKHFHRLKERKVIEEGKRIFRKHFPMLMDSGNRQVWRHLSSSLDISSPEELYYAMGEGKLKSPALKRAVEESVGKTLRKPVGPVASSAPAKQGRASGDSKDEILLIGENLESSGYKFATCCNPLPGEDVFGFLTISEGIKIHRTSCPNSPTLISRYPYRVLEAIWKNRDDPPPLPVKIHIQGTNRVGVMSDISMIIAEKYNSSIESMAFETNHGIFRGTLDVLMENVTKLEAMLHSLVSVAGVEHAKRVKAFSSPSDLN